MQEMIIEAIPDNFEKVQQFIDSELDRLGCSAKAKFQIDVAVEELFVNIAHYAYNPETGKATIKVSSEDDPPAVVITFMDSGKPYDPLARKDPDVTLSAEERQIGGLGIYMVKKSMDGLEYEYSNGMNILKIKKLIG